MYNFSAFDVSMPERMWENEKKGENCFLRCDFFRYNASSACILLFLVLKDQTDLRKELSAVPSRSGNAADCS